MVFIINLLNVILCDLSMSGIAYWRTSESQPVTPILNGWTPTPNVTPSNYQYWQSINISFSLTKCPSKTYLH